MVQFTLSRCTGGLPAGAGYLPAVAARFSVLTMHIVYRAENLFDAHLVKDALEHAEIPAFISGEYLTGAVGQLPAMDYIAVMVPESSVAVANGVVREVEGRLSEARQAIDERGGLPDDPLTLPC